MGTSLPGSTSPGASSRLRPGTHVGRYVLLSRLGQGGMGVVYAAFDPDLDRKVAVKLLQAERGPAAAAHRTRLLREAQALARLNHPNVVAVHDVGTVGERVWIAMEFIDGTTLGQWCRQQPRAWSEVLDVLQDAGRGLRAAHDAGLLHRDFKPENVMVGEDGRVRVMDFGLARARSDEEEPNADVLLESTPALRIDLTQAGAVVGTPAFMAPEQLAGQAADERSDQYAFCVTMWEALYESLPFGGHTAAEQAQSKSQGRLRRPASSSVPAWVKQVCERGLSKDPDDRFASIDELLAALEQGRARIRRRRLAAALGLLAAIAVSAVAVDRIREGQRVAACEDEGARIEPVWSDATKDRVVSALTALDAPYAEDTAAKVRPWLDDYARAWREARTEVCLRNTVHETWADDTTARARWCLDDRKIRLHALVTELSHGTHEGARRAVSAAASLAPTSPCLDPMALARQPPPPPAETRETIAEVLALLASSDSIDADVALGHARTAIERASALGWTPLLAESLLAEAAALQLDGEYDEAEATYERAYETAASSGAWETAGRAARGLVQLVGSIQARYDEGEQWAIHARVMNAHAGDPLGFHEAALGRSLATVYFARGRYDDAERLAKRVIEIHTEVLGPEHPSIAQDLNSLGAVQLSTGRYDDAEASFQRAMDLEREVLGPEHPHVADLLNNLGGVYHQTDRLDDAIEAVGKALAIQERAYGLHQARVAETQSNLALLLRLRGDAEQARTLLEHALATLRESFGSRHPQIATTLNNLANVHMTLGDLQRARDLHAQALAIREAVLPADHPQVDRSVLNLASTEYELGNLERAEALFLRLVEHRTKRLDDDDPLLASALAALGQTELSRDRAPKARPRLERAVAIFDAHEDHGVDAAKARLWLAQALAATEGDLARATALAQRARDGFEQHGEHELLEQAQTWLDRHRAPSP